MPVMMSVLSAGNEVDNICPSVEEKCVRKGQIGEGRAKDVGILPPKEGPSCGAGVLHVARVRILRVGRGGRWDLPSLLALSSWLARTRFSICTKKSEVREPLQDATSALPAAPGVLMKRASTCKTTVRITMHSS